ncbi:alpha-galactosidase [Paenibacillus sp. GCM10012307]|uniref:Alpha-galactosidase n=1 Tax=Paenibacillus roseus TaxID=2798579 RepID=A0A934J1B5_9BACL|nr:alpha-galactosidase [Paenibacillus roseus]MBJ6361484.1 alpha-galactosidase [Paenibacillus roseus]
MNQTLDLSNGNIRYVMDLSRGAALRSFGLPGGPEWVAADRSGLDFAVYAEGSRIDGQSEGLSLLGAERHIDGSGAEEATLRFLHLPTGLEIESHIVLYEEGAVAKKWIAIRNVGSQPIKIDRVDSFHLVLPHEEWTVHSFESDWGAEFSPVAEPLTDSIVLETKQGRSSKHRHPWMTLKRGEGEGLLTVCPMWSGNWILRCEREEDFYALSGGLHDWMFFKTLAPGESMESVHVALALGSGNDLNSVSVSLARVGKNYWYPRNELSRSLPVEWNHWWSYEDKTIDEQSFLANVEAAASAGIEVCTLDAGWFGPSDGTTEWYDYRGDWDRVNDSRFPGGIRKLSDVVRGKGMKFGLWCEIEAVGKLAALANDHPDYIAKRDGESLGYLCFGNPEVQEWAFQTLDKLIADYHCDWVKLDFNLDPGAGCNCEHHGHGAGDGLYEHYIGYYAVLDRIRGKHPHVLLENCASGGLRIDLGILQHTHTTFLSDPDWPEHSLQVFWGATTFLAPENSLHWSYSDWLGNHPHQKFNPGDPALSLRQFDYYTRIAMLHGFGLSQKLPDLPGHIRERLVLHIDLYRSVVRRFVREGDMYRLTGQPQREGKGERWAAFQYAMPEGDEHLLFVFRLDRSEASRTILLQGLNPGDRYELQWLSEDRHWTGQGAYLAKKGLLIGNLLEEDSALIFIRKIV